MIETPRDRASASVLMMRSRSSRKHGLPARPKVIVKPGSFSYQNSREILQSPHYSPRRVSQVLNEVVETTGDDKEDPKPVIGEGGVSSSASTSVASLRERLDSSQDVLAAETAKRKELELRLLELQKQRRERSRT